MKELTVKAEVKNLGQVTAFVDAELEALDCSPKAQMQIDVAIDELFGNIAQYAYENGEGDATVRVDYDEPNRTVILTFLDSGVPFNPLEREEPDISVPAEERGIGGLGIFLVRKTMDQVDYRYENRMNILTVRKKVDA